MSGHHAVVTEDRSDPDSGSLPADPRAYDSPRAERARAKGLKAPYIAGGGAPDAAAARAEERRLGRILLLMVLVIVSSGFVIGTIVALLSPAAGR